MKRQLSQYMGTHYYNLLLHYFYKIILLRVSFEYSKINWDKDEEYVKLLIKLITLFSSLYYYQEVSTRSEGNELSQMFRRSFNIDMLFKEVNNTLNELYKSQENNASDRMNMLLFILTVFTVVSGIYGMNLVIKDWESPTGWKAFSSYTIFEWVSLITAVSGIVLSGLLIFSTVRKLVVNKIRQYRSDNHFE
jgi:Mg2+ and Co2+ transporter CorA